MLDWLRYLVASAGYADARDAIDYYAKIEWIDDAAAVQLQAFLDGFGDDGDTNTLTVEQHIHSLQYICKLDNNAAVALDGADSIATEEEP